MFDQLSQGITKSLRLLSGQGKISESNIQNTIEDIRVSLLEADVHFQVVQRFIKNVKQRSLGEKVLHGVNPGQQFTKIVHSELVEVLGGRTQDLKLQGTDLQILFLVGLQGVGKTTTASKLAIHIQKKQDLRTCLVSVDIYRPGAMDQLQILGENLGLPVFPSRPEWRPSRILKEAQSWATKQGAQVLIVDTAGRLQLDTELMNELRGLKSLCSPQEILLVADAMLGQQSVDVARGFHDQVGLTGLILTKMDGDARGGAALSIRQSLGLPIPFVGVGEKSSDLEVFHPDRLASRILDMGDVVGLVEKAQEVLDQEEAEKIAQKMMSGEFTAEDFLKQLRMIQKMGRFQGLMKMLPGMGSLSQKMKSMAPPEEELKKIEAIICSMTLEERRDCRIINGSRRLRIAKGSGTRVQDVIRFVKKFENSKGLMSTLMKQGLPGGTLTPWG